MNQILRLLEGGRPNHRLYALFSDIDELQEYFEAMDDRSKLALIGIVKKYRSRLRDLEREIKRASVSDRHDADVVLTTAHKAKGQEYERVAVLDNFIKGFLEPEAEPDLGDWRTREEINLLYVAMTRAQTALKIPFAVAAVKARTESTAADSISIGSVAAASVSDRANSTENR